MTARKPAPKKLNAARRRTLRDPFPCLLCGKGPAVYVVRKNRYHFRCALALLENGCPVHADQHHGREAEELRKGVEEIADGIEADDAPEQIRIKLYALLDVIDARDSLAYLERRGAKKRKRKPC